MAIPQPTQIRKLKRIEQFLREMEPAEGPATFEGFSGNTVFKRFIERNIELSIERMIDICRHLVSGLDLQEPETYAACFEILGNAGIIPESSVETFKSMTRYRNFRTLDLCLGFFKEGVQKPLLISYS